MERIKLSKTEKRAFLGLARSGNLREMQFASKEEVRKALCHLHYIGLVWCAFVEGGDVEDVRITLKGRAYLECNPKLRNPVDWERVLVVAFAIAVLLLLIFLFAK